MLIENMNEQQLEISGFIIGVTGGACIICKKHTHIIDIAFESPVCSTACEAQLIAEYNSKIESMGDME